jgi:Na+-translocating ferredoxin:NAD+ oxidoreductase RnfA subunit
MILNSIFYYIFCCSGILIYGIGLKKLIITSKTWKSHWMNYLESSIVCALSSVGSWLVVVYILAPVQLIELTPMTCILIHLLISLVVSFIFSKCERISLLDISISFPCVLLAVTESVSILQCLCIVLSCCTAYYLMIPIIFAIRERIKTSHPLKEFKTGALIFISIAIIMCAFFAINISWINLWR